MALIERTAYPRLKSNPSKGELARLYTPTLQDIELAKRVVRGEGRSLAFLVMLKSFQRLGYFPAPEEVPEPVIYHIRSRLGTSTAAPAGPSLRSRQRYRDAIRDHLQVKPYGDEVRRTAAEAMAEAALTMDEPADLVNVAIEELVKERFELPAFSAFDNLVRHVRYTVNFGLFARVDERLSEAGKHRLDALVEAGPTGRSDLNYLKAIPKSPTRKNLDELHQRLVWLESGVNPYSRTAPKVNSVNFGIL